MSIDRSIDSSFNEECIRDGVEGEPLTPRLGMSMLESTVEHPDGFDGVDNATGEYVEAEAEIIHYVDTVHTNEMQNPIDTKPRDRFSRIIGNKITKRLKQAAALGLAASSMIAPATAASSVMRQDQGKPKSHNKSEKPPQVMVTQDVPSSNWVGIGAYPLPIIHKEHAKTPDSSVQFDYTIPAFSCLPASNASPYSVVWSGLNANENKLYQEGTSMTCDWGSDTPYIGVLWEVYNASLPTSGQSASYYKGNYPVQIGDKILDRTIFSAAGHKVTMEVEDFGSSYTNSPLWRAIKTVRGNVPKNTEADCTLELPTPFNPAKTDNTYSLPVFGSLYSPFVKNSPRESSCDLRVGSQNYNLSAFDSTLPSSVNIFHYNLTTYNGSKTLATYEPYGQGFKIQETNYN
jgi:hypothetical protein